MFMAEDQLVPADAHGRGEGRDEVELLWYAFELPKPCPLCLSSLPTVS